MKNYKFLVPILLKTDDKWQVLTLYLYNHES